MLVKYVSSITLVITLGIAGVLIVGILIMKENNKNNKCTRAFNKAYKERAKIKAEQEKNEQHEISKQCFDEAIKNMPNFKNRKNVTPIERI